MKMKRKTAIAVTAAVGVAVAVVLISMVVRDELRRRPVSSSRYCSSNLRNIGQGCQLYALDHEGRMPASFDVLQEERYLPEPSIFECRHGRFRYVSGLRADMPQDFVLAFEAPRIQHKGLYGYFAPPETGEGYRNVLFIAGNVVWMPEDQLEALLAHTLEGAAKLGFEAKVLGRRE